MLLAIYKAYSTIAIRTVDIISEHNWFVKVFLLLMAALAPLTDYIHFLILLLIMDAATSIYYQFKQNVAIVLKNKTKKTLGIGERFTILAGTIESRKLRRTVEKLFAYILGIIVCFFFDKIVFQITPLDGEQLSYFSITNVSVVLICSVELTSILANLGKITNNPIYARIIKIFNKKINEQIGDENSETGN
jgi:hypothetical protein